MKRRRIAVDMDGVLANFFGRLFDLYFERRGVRYSVDQVHVHDLADVYGAETYEVMHAMFNEPGFFASIQPYPGAIETVEALLSQGHDVHICTAPTVITLPSGKRGINPHCVIEKFDWIARYLPSLSKKVGVFKEKNVFRADFLVDDAARNIDAWCAESPCDLGLVVPRPWNESYVIPTNAKRLHLADLPAFLSD